MPLMIKRLLLPSALGVLVTMTGCANHGNSYSNDDLKSRLVYDLVKKNSRYAENQLQDRGYTESGRDGKHSWWYNNENNNCYEIEESDGEVKKVHLKRESDCRHANKNGSNHHQQPNNSNAHPKNLPQSARAACINRFGHHNFDNVDTLSPLKPGFWELIMVGKDGRKAACTVNEHNTIVDWVDL